MDIKMKPKTFHYEVGTRWSGEKRGVLSLAGKPDLEVASPPEFRGHPGVWSPQDLLVAAVNACAMTTFLSAVKQEHQEAALAAFKEAESGCIIARSIHARIESEPRIVVMQRVPAAAAR
jgi:organic hydroperoxide reductase OsmC/OhrA